MQDYRRRTVSQNPAAVGWGRSEYTLYWKSLGLLARLLSSSRSFSYKRRKKELQSVRKHACKVCGVQALNSLRGSQPQASIMLWEGSEAGHYCMHWCPPMHWADGGVSQSQGANPLHYEWQQTVWITCTVGVYPTQQARLNCCSAETASLQAHSGNTLLPASAASRATC